uniref:Uncharacterized protein n=1 Tax=Knipowitschia caucasica TaxID=637954 RepID=A0AAV2J3V1_KNICA
MCSLHSSNSLAAEKRRDAWPLPSEHLLVRGHNGRSVCLPRAHTLGGLANKCPVILSTLVVIDSVERVRSTLEPLLRCPRHQAPPSACSSKVTTSSDLAPPPLWCEKVSESALRTKV